MKKIIQDILLVALEDESDITESLCHELGQLRRISWDMFADLRKTNGVAFNNDTVLNVIKSIKADPEVDIIAFQHIASKIVQGKLVRIKYFCIHTFLQDFQLIIFYLHFVLFVFIYFQQLKRVSANS